MRHGVWMVLPVVVGMVILSCRQQDKEAGPELTPVKSAADASPAESEQPLLLLDEEPLLLLDDEEADDSTDKDSYADNDRCLTCHLNYAKEELAVIHQRVGFGCAKCHGACDEHIADESWASGGNGTAPDIMYPREKINPACMKCHPKEDIITQKKHKALFASTDGKDKQKVCTDCHGEHRLDPARRKCKWK